MTTKPGRCNLLSYKFQVATDKPIAGYSRPIPFALRPAVREQINQMLRDDILEISTSPILNPLTVVTKEGGKIRVCVDARKVNQFTIPDRERTQPLQELLQRFNNSRYLTSLDLSSAYLKIELQEESRKYTTFLFDSTVYQFKRVPYGIKNSLPAFIGAIKLALGGSNIENVVFYIDDILIHSKTFEEHLRHLDTVLGKLLKKEADQCPKEEALADKLLKAYARMKLKAEKRNRKRKTGRTQWEPRLQELLLVKCQPTSDAVQGVTSKFQGPYEGPYRIQKKISTAICEIGDTEDKLWGLFNIKHLKPFRLLISTHSNNENFGKI
jgi:hypothetical protein